MSCTQDQIAENPAVIRYPVGYAESAVQVESGGNGVACRTYSADALSYVLGVTRVSSLKDKLNAPEKSPCALSLLYRAIFQVNFNLEVSFDTSNGV